MLLLFLPRVGCAVAASTYQVFDNIFVEWHIRADICINRAPTVRMPAYIHTEKFASYYYYRINHIDMFLIWPFCVTDAVYDGV